MLKNLYKAWHHLAPNESTFWDRVTRTLGWADQDALEDHIRRCIVSRGWWFEVKHSNGYFSVDIRTMVEGHAFVLRGKRIDFYYLFLTAYLRCVAAQRQIACGQWERFSGEVIEVIGCGRWDAHSGFEAKDYVSTDQILFRLVEEPNHKVMLNRYCDGTVDYTPTTSLGGWGDRVLYTASLGGWARKPEDFLGLISEEYPEHEGLLRFSDAN
jgi:hypothetical protein